MCVVISCDLPGQTRGYCSGHYHRLIRYGDATYAPPPRPKTQCNVDGCTGVKKGAGYCSKHYRRFLRHGDPLGGGIAYGEANRFIESVQHAETDDCIAWPYCKTKDGYGRLSWKGQPSSAHVVAATLAHGPRPSDKHEVCHSCGNGSKGCVNPRHLYWGTRKDNVADAIRHGTAFPVKTMVRSGEASHSAKYTDVQIADMLRRVDAGETQAAVARDTGISAVYLNQLTLGRLRAARMPR